MASDGPEDGTPRTNEAEIKVVGRSGQISQGKRYAGKALRLERLEDGRIVLTTFTMVPASQFRTLREPHRSRIERGLKLASATEPSETDLAKGRKPLLAPP